ncbi:PIN domain-containing protein [uncultured Jatrophihabitans sp.]|uniref:PIN domain-containing protein n=1 Tax=uncultured Jatrophihabitans sp. TaxID=1610747 RepID=UPI0035C95F95
MSLVLDAGALIAIERADRDTAAVIEAARQDRREIVVPAGVVGQVWRGGSRQARLARLLNARDVVVEPLTDAGARAAGILCGAAGTADVVDASVVLAARRRHATVISSDRPDLRQLDPTIPVVDC